METKAKALEVERVGSNNIPGPWVEQTTALPWTGVSWHAGRNWKLDWKSGVHGESERKCRP